MLYGTESKSSMRVDRVGIVVAEVLQLRAPKAMEQGPLDIDTADTESQGGHTRKPGKPKDPDFYTEALAASSGMEPAPPAKRAPKKGSEQAPKRPQTGDKEAPQTAAKKGRKQAPKEGR